MLYLTERHAPIEGLQKYDPEKDISFTGAYTDFEITPHRANQEVQDDRCSDC